MLSRTWSWLISLADPGGPARALPRRRLSEAKLASVLDWARRHHVLPAVLDNARTVVEREGAGRILAGPEADARTPALLAAWRDKLVAPTGLALLVRAQLGELSAALAGRPLTVMLLKGADFAERLYPRRELRLFGDADLLVARRDLGEVGGVLAGLGYEPAPAEALRHGAEYGEAAWHRPARPGGMVEVHWNLVNSPALHRSVSVTLEDLARAEPCAGLPGLPGLCVPSPAGRLLAACVHGATGHEFDRLRMLTDILQAARAAAGPIDVHWLGEAIERTGAGLAVAAGLRLAGRMFGEDRLPALRRRLGLRLPRGLGLILSRGVLLRAHAWRDSFRRKMFRQMLKRGVQAGPSVSGSRS